MLNPLGCGGHQYGNNSRRFGIVRIFLTRVLSFILLLILAPIILFVVTPVMCTAGCFEIMRCNRNFSRLTCVCKLFVLLMAMVGFALGVVSNVIVLPLAIVFGIPTLICIQIQERYERHHRANQRLRERLS